MGSSHSAPRRPGSRRRLSQESGPHAFHGEYNSSHTSASASEWPPVEDELPSLLEEVASTPSSSIRRRDQQGLSVIQSSRPMRQEELNVEEPPEHSFSSEADDNYSSPVTRRLPYNHNQNGTNNYNHYNEEPNVNAQYQSPQAVTPSSATGATATANG